MAQLVEHQNLEQVRNPVQARSSAVFQLSLPCSVQHMYNVSIIQNASLLESVCKLHVQCICTVYISSIQLTVADQKWE